MPSNHPKHGLLVNDWFFQKPHRVGTDKIYIDQTWYCSGTEIRANAIPNAQTNLENPFWVKAHHDSPNNTPRYKITI